MFMDGNGARPGWVMCGVCKTSGSAEEMAYGLWPCTSRAARQQHHASGLMRTRMTLGAHVMTRFFLGGEGGEGGALLRRLLATQADGLHVGALAGAPTAARAAL